MRFLLFLLVSILTAACSEHILNNPYDPNTENFTPPILSASQGTGNFVRIVWEEIDFAEQYLLFRWDDHDPAQELILTTTATGYEDYDVLYGTIYYYAVQVRLTTGITTGKSNQSEGYRDLPMPGLTLTDENYQDRFCALGEQVPVKKLRRLKIDTDNLYPGLRLEYMAHMAYHGNTTLYSEGDYIDFSYDERFLIEKFAIKTPDEKAEEFDVIYEAGFRDTSTNTFFSVKATNGEFCTTKNSASSELEYIKVQLLRKSSRSEAPVIAQAPRQ